MDKVRRDKRKEVHARLDFGESSRERRAREGSHYSSVRSIFARPEIYQHVLDRLGHRRQSAFDRLSKTYSPSTTKARPGRTRSRDHSRGRSRLHRLDASNEDRLENRERFRDVGKSYDNSYSSYRTGINNEYRYHDRDRSRHMKKGKDSESPLSSVSKKIYNIKQKDGETIEEFMELFKVEIGRMKGAPKCMRISAFMHGVNNSELTKRLNEHVTRTMEEMTITTTAFIRGEAAAASKKKGHTSWRTQDQEITFPPLATNSEAEGQLVIEAEIGGHMIHRMLLITTGYADHSKKSWMNFMIVRSLSSYNGIIGRPGIKEIQAVPSTVYRMLKFPADGDMTGVPRSVAEHRLNIWEGYSPARQKKGGQASERVKAIQTGVKKLVEAGIMREVYYHDWLSNQVMVKKHDSSYRMCVDFTNLNKACPQDCYPLPEIDWKVESLCGYPFKCFLDAYKGYHQIQLAESDEEKTTFHTCQGVCCYTKMPFGLKNAGATYQLLLDKAFDSQIGQNIEVAISTVLMTEREMVQKPVYFVSHALQGPKLNYISMEKLVFSLVFAAKRLRRAITKIEHHAGRTQYHLPAKDVMERIDPSVFPCRNARRKFARRISSGNSTRAVDTLHGWIVMCGWVPSNNEAEYEALIAGLRIATQMAVQNVHVSVDSKLVANQVLGAYVAKEENMIKYLEKVKSL
nr:reverse transcriptase domain-containing protein [Tanacetum cinerariifolium]